MRSRASKTGCVALLSLAATFGCVKPNTNVALADGDRHKPTVARATVAEHEVDAGRRPYVERMHFAASVSGLGDMLDAGEQIYAQWVPPEPGAPPLDLQSYIDVALVQLGFGPAWFASVDLDGLHTAAFGLPHEDQIGVSMADYEFAATIATRNPSGLIEGLPAEPAPQQLEANLWQLDVEDDLRLLLRTRADTLEAATSFTLLDSLVATRAALQPGPGDPRLRLSMSGFDDDALELGPILTERGIEPAKQREILDAVRLELHGDFGSDRDLVAHAAVVAPFGSELGGPALTDTSALAKLLPGGAWLVMVQAWALPVTLAELRKQIDTRDLPATFAALVEQLLAHGDDLVAQLGSENASAVYVDGKGRGTLVFLSSVADEQAAKTAMRELFASVERASPNFSWLLRAKLEPDGLRAGKLRGDVLSIELPEDVRDELDGMPWLLGTGSTPTLELSAMVSAGKLVIAIGPGQRELQKTLAPRLAGSPDAGLERGGGLARARELTGGCQTCIAIDPVAIAEGLLAILAASPDADRAFRKLIDSTRKRLLGLGIGGELSIAGRFDAQRWELAVRVPKTLLFLDPDVPSRILESVEAVREGYDRIGGPSSEQICEHVFKVLEREMGSSSTLTADDRQRFFESCVKEMAKEREKIGDDTFRKQAKCVVEARKLEEMTKCEKL